MEAQVALLGSWHLRSWTQSDDRGVSHPFGPRAHGLLLYAPDGQMSAVVTAAERLPLPGGKPRDGSDAALATAFLSFFTYAGRWHVEGDTVVHTVALALNPNTVGTEQRRRMTWTGLGPEGSVVPGTGLELSAHEPTSRGGRDHRLTWARR